jgi:hypothetical protein
MTISISIDAIRVGRGRRRPDRAKVKMLADSIASLGLRMPITVLPVDDEGRYPLVAGGNRVEACRLLGHSEIAAEVETDRLTAQLWEVAENLHRADLTAAQRASLVGRWAKLLKRRGNHVVLRQVGAKIPIGRPAGGVREAARQMGISEVTARRAINISDHLSKTALREAERLGLLNNQRALSSAADFRDNADAQVADLQRTAERSRKRKGQRAQMKAALKGTDEYTKAAGKAKFHAWFDAQDITDQIQVRLWLQSGEADAYFEEWQQMFLRSKAKALH